MDVQVIKDEGRLFSEKVVVKLYDSSEKEIGMTIGGAKEIAYAMAHSKRIVKAVSHSPLFGKEVTERASLSQRTLDKVKDQKKLGENLLFWVGEPLVVNK